MSDAGKRVGQRSSVTPSDVIDFWRAAGPSKWFTKDSAFDRAIREQFLTTWQAASTAELATWEASDEGLLALILVLDQFPRNMFRDDARAFSTDALALKLADRAIANGLDRRVDANLVQFIYMPLMHSEVASNQWRCVKLFEAFDRGGSADQNLAYAKIHAEIIERFGRFPHRNRLLGRASTADEQAFLDKGGFSG